MSVAAPEPLVSCIMPTADRRAFAAQAIRYFRRQEYAVRELVLIDDGEDPVADLAAGDERIRYVRMPARATIGHERNVACAAARGSVIAHWDDDDWYGPERLTRQVEALTAQGAAVCGLRRVLYLSVGRRPRVAIRVPGQPAPVGGGQHPRVLAAHMGRASVRRVRRRRGHAVRVELRPAVRARAGGRVVASRRHARPEHERARAGRRVVERGRAGGGGSTTRR